MSCYISSSIIYAFIHNKHVSYSNPVMAQWHPVADYRLSVLCCGSESFKELAKPSVTILLEGRVMW